MASDVKIEGGMRPTWISEIATGPGVNKLMGEIADETKKKANARAKAATGGRGSWSNHYTSIYKKGPWGRTYIIWPTSPMARKNDTWLKSAISTAMGVFDKLK